MLAALWGDAPIGGEGSIGWSCGRHRRYLLFFENAGAHKSRWAPEREEGKGSNLVFLGLFATHVTKDMPLVIGSVG